MGQGKHDADVLNKVMDEEIASRVPIPSPEKAKDELGFEDNVAWVRDPAMTNTPENLIGRVYYKVEGDEDLRSHAYSLELEVDERSKLENPIVRQEMVLTQETAANAGFLEFVSVKVGSKEVIEFRVIDNAAAAAKVVGNQWLSQLEEWFERQRKAPLMGDRKLAYCAVVTGVVQKYVTSKRFSEFETTGKGGGYGLNVGGRLYVSSSEFSLDIVYGLSLQDLTPFIQIESAESMDVLREAVKDGGDLDPEKLGGSSGLVTTREFGKSLLERRAEFTF